MESLTRSLEAYLSNVTGRKVKIHPFDVNGVPRYLTQQYDFYRLLVGDVPMIAILLRQEEQFSPARFVKHVRNISFIHIDQVCVVSKALPSYVRKRLIERGVGFVVPNRHAYLPLLATDARSGGWRPKGGSVERFSPATQVVVVDVLLGRTPEPVTSIELSKRLGYSTMSMSRALDELEAARIGEVKREGKQRLLAFANTPDELWRKVLPYLTNPISRIERILQREADTRLVLPAGLTALSSRSMLGEPDYPEYAVSRNVWKQLKASGIDTIPVEDTDTCVIQVWRYDPRVLEVDGQVDPFSLYLTLKDESDERVEMALEEMMERYL